MGLYRGSDFKNSAIVMGRSFDLDVAVCAGCSVVRLRGPSPS